MFHTLDAEIWMHSTRQKGPVDRFDVRTAPSELAVEEIAAADGGYVRRLRSTSYAADE